MGPLINHAGGNGFFLPHGLWFFNSVISRIFHNFGSTGPIFKIFTVLKMASKFVCSFSLAKERSMKNKAARANRIISVIT